MRIRAVRDLNALGSDPAADCPIVVLLQVLAAARDRYLVSLAINGAMRAYRIEVRRLDSRDHAITVVEADRELRRDLADWPHAMARLESLIGDIALAETSPSFERAATARDGEPAVAPGTAARLRAVMRTDLGKRDINEDAAYIDPDHQFFIVADGVGGHAAGEIASTMTVELVRRTLERARSRIAAYAAAPDEAGREGLFALLKDAVREAHQAVLQRAVREPDKQGMGTTLEVVLVAGCEAFVAHVGDSRTYLVRDGSASQLTSDHTLGEVLRSEGKVTAEEARGPRLRSVLVNAVGAKAELGIELTHLLLRGDDQLLLSSDGLHDHAQPEELAERLSWGEPEHGLDELVALAKERGSSDNITGLVVDVVAIRANAAPT
jgi:serine/threonine protein phosphatase PrpC